LESALFRLDNGHRNYIEGVLEVVERSGGFGNFCYVWKNPQIREVLRLSWA
jgi:hypothetical protein